MVKDPAEQIVDVCVRTVGFGFTVTVTLKLDPVHEPDVGVTV